ncbi:hypothetical protein FHT72_006511 [Rhizobium sp. BK077]|uniref:hypothetical protein n=1 Tax=unclassified Rhizobium TaxID=2613769 RepID=UPI001615CD4A|nr:MULTISPECIES: hypothetical protein [unclassified Rhizobium]MBB3303086.1 hypothetical protein [Rhizobium sp. BK112]MBB3371979.1 hypothetical protein [Rhizobium sp. BK077]MBB4182945.1 hypothetical protein [Rhizobium sp. BK109]
MKAENIRIVVSATHDGNHVNGEVPAAYAMRVLADGIDRTFTSGGRVAEVQSMYAVGLEVAFNYLLAELSDQVTSTRPIVEVVVKSPKMSVRFDQGSESLLEKTVTGKTKARDNIETWLANAVMATHFEIRFRRPIGDEKAILKSVEKLAKGEAQKHAQGRFGSGPKTW